MRKTNYDSKVEFFRRIQQDAQSGCWVWLGGYKNGYGIFGLGGRGQRRYAHRYAYEEIAGKTIPVDREIDHLCRNPGCVNPTHLEAVTKKENILRGICPMAVNARKITCIHGHPFTLDNTIVERTGGRRCRICKAEKDRRYDERRRSRNG